MQNYIIYITFILILFIIYYIIINNNSYNIIEYEFISLGLVPYNQINFNLLLSFENQIEPIKLYYINMNKSIERKNRFLKRMSKFNNYELQRVKAITPEDLYNYKIKMPWYCKSMHNKEKACLLSHFKGIETSYNNNDNYSIIAEDDMIITKNINWDYFISILPDNWEIIQLYYFKLPFINNTYFKQLQKDNFLIKTDNVLTSAAAYLINKKGMQNILSNINNNEINLLHQKDYCLSDYVIYSNINRYILTYPIIKTEEIDSTLNPHYIKLRKIANVL